MNKTLKYISGIGLIAGVVFTISSCEKTFDDKLPVQDDFSNSTTVQVIVATVNATRNHIFVDGQRITGANLVSGSIFPSTGYGFQVPNGLTPFLVRDTLGTATQAPLSFAENMMAASHQTIFLYDTITTPKQKTVIDLIEVPEDTTARIRFGHFAYNPVTLPPALDVYSARQGRNIFTNVNYTDVTGFVPIASGVSDTLYLRPAGTTTNLQNVTGTTWADLRIILTPTMRRSYTLVFRGSYRTTLTTNANVRTLSLYATR